MAENSLTDFIRDRLTPAIFDNLDRVFPDWHFKKDSRGYWITNLRPNKTPSDNRGRHNRSQVNPKYPKYLFGHVEQQNYDLIDLWKADNNVSSTYEAAEAISKLLGVEGMPERGNSEAYEKRKADLSERERLLSMMRNAMASANQAAWDVTEYLCKRGYKGEYIEKLKEWGICCLTPEIAAQLGDNSPYDGFNASAYKLVIPYYNRGELLGFTFRDITGTKTPKYLFKRGQWKGSNLFGLTGLNLTGNNEKDRTLYITEGQLDALHASLEGLENVVAAGGVTLNVEALQQAKARGVQRVVIIFDNEGDPKKDAERDVNRENALRLILSLGMEGFSVKLPTEEGEKTDLDSYLNTHTIEDLRTEIERMTPAPLFIYEVKKDRYLEKFNQQRQQEDWDPLDMSDYMREIIDLLRDPNINEIWKAKIREFVESDTGMNREALRKEAEKLKAADDILRHRSETKRVTDHASQLATEGRAEEVLEYLKNELPRLSQIKRETKFSHLLTIPSVEDFEREMREKKAGILTRYTLKKGKEIEPLTIPSGALTLVCAPTSHGKSTLLQNLALQVARDEGEGAVLYFTFEEEASSVKIQMLNKFLNRTITDGNNIRTLTDYFKTGTYSDYFRRAERENFEKVKQQFYDQFLTTGRIRIFREEWDAVELRDAIAYLSQRIKVKAVFIDYIQLLRIKGFKGDLRLELAEISRMFNNLAIDTSLPIILGAQLNRDAASPLELHAQNLAESADIERYAHLIIALWNTAFKPTTKSSKGNSKDIEDFQKANNITLGEGGNIYMTLLKNRGGIVGAEGMATYNGNTGIITQDEIGEDIMDNTPSKSIF